MINDNSLMPFGKYKGSKMIDVPASYLLWLYDNGLKDGDIKNYILDNMVILEWEVKHNK